MSGYAVVAKAAATVAEDAPEGWPDGWPFPPSGGDAGPWPPGFESGMARFSSPSPADDATDVDVDADLSWSFSGVFTSYEIMLSGSVAGTSSTATYALDALTIGTNYTWRVFARGGLTTVVSPEWSFRTEYALSGSTTATSSAESAALVDLMLPLGSEDITATAAADDAYCTTYDPPAAPSDMTIAWGGGIGVSPFYKLQAYWTDNSSNEDGFHAQQRTSSGSWAELNGWNAAQIAADLESKLSTSGLNGTYDYYGRIRSWRTEDGITVYSAWTVSPLLPAAGPWP